MGAPRRVMKGQVAGVYALMLVGACNYGEACDLVGVDRQVMRDYVLKDWRRPRLAIPQREMTQVQFNVYRKFRSTLGIDAAHAEVRRMIPHGAAAPNTQEM